LKNKALIFTGHQALLLVPLPLLAVDWRTLLTISKQGTSASRRHLAQNVLAKFQVSAARPKAHTLKGANTMQLRSMQLNWLISKQSVASCGREGWWYPGRKAFLWPATTFSRPVSPPT